MYRLFRFPPWRRLAATLAALWVITPVFAQERPFTAADALDVVTFTRSGRPLISPDGEWVAYVTVDISREGNIRAFWPTGFLHLVSGDGKRHLNFEAEGNAGDPVWSPDSRVLAFFIGELEQRRLAFLDVSTGRVRVVDEPIPGARANYSSRHFSPQWTPDGATLIVARALSPPVEAAPAIQSLKSSDPQMPDDAYFTDADLWQLEAVDVASRRRKTLTPSAIALRGFRVSSTGVLYRAALSGSPGKFSGDEFRRERGYWLAPLDGGAAPQRIAVESAAPWLVFGPAGGELLVPRDGQLWALRLKDAGTRVVVKDFPEPAFPPAVSASSRRLAMLVARPGTGSSDPDLFTTVSPLFDLTVLDLDSGKAEVVTPADHRDEISGLFWSADGETLFYRAKSRLTFAESLYRWRRSTVAPVLLVAADEVMGDLSASSDGTRLAFTAMSATRPEDAFLVSVETNRRRRLTDLNPQIASFGLTAPEIVAYQTAEGDPRRALLYKPKGASAADPVPLVTYTYEMLTPFKNRFYPKAQMHVSRGYAFLMPDVVIKFGLTGQAFVDSVAPAVAAARAQGFTNGKVGIYGGSFGGYSGMFLISQLSLFDAAVVRAPPVEFFTSWATGKDRDALLLEYIVARNDGTPYDVPERYRINSPFFFADRINTPVLILHGTHDQQVPLQQGKMMFQALRRLGKTAELVIYQDADHSVVRGSRRNYLDFYRRTFEWWARYLRKTESQD